MRTSLVVALGAALGASARWWVGDVVPSAGFPWATLLVNVVGCTAVGWCAIGLVRGTAAWCFVVTGCLGGFTTASAFAVETRRLLDDGRTALASLYVIVSVTLGLAAVSAARAGALRWATR